MFEQTPPRQESTVFQPRSGVAIGDAVAILEQPPQKPLTEQQKAEVMGWNADLVVGRARVGDHDYDISTDEDYTLDEALRTYRYLSQVYEINLDYFLTDKGHAALEKSGMIAGQKPTNVDQLGSLFMQASYGAPTKTIKSLALASKHAEDARMAAELVNGQVPTPPTRVRVFSDGTNLMARLQALKTYRSFFSKVSRAIGDQEEVGTVDEAKLTCLQINQQIVNTELAALYPDVLNFWYQAKNFPEPQREMITSAIEQAWPLVKNKREDYLRGQARRLFVRLDYLRNGIARDGHGAFGSVSQELQEYLETPVVTSEQDTTPLLSPQELTEFDEMVFNAADMKEFAEYVLAELGLLSSDTGTVSKDRPQRAKDGKWQVLIRDDISSMGAEDPPGILEIPANFDRNLTKSSPPAGAIPGLGHELKHIFQHENRRVISSNGGNAIGGKNKTVYAEAGAIAEEKDIQQRWFGRSRQDNPHYMRAMLVIQGQVANEGETVEGRAIRASYDSYMAANPTESPSEAALIAVSRVMRLVRRKGGYDSQPLNYAESALLVEKTKHLSPHIRGLLFDVANFDIQSLAALHQFDLLPDHVRHFSRDRFADIVLPYLRNKVAKKKQSNT